MRGGEEECVYVLEQVGSILIKTRIFSQKEKKSMYALPQNFAALFKEFKSSAFNSLLAGAFCLGSGMWQSGGSWVLTCG